MKTNYPETTKFADGHVSIIIWNEDQTKFIYVPQESYLPGPFIIWSRHEFWDIIDGNTKDIFLNE